MSRKQSIKISHYKTRCHEATELLTKAFRNTISLIYLYTFSGSVATGLASYTLFSNDGRTM